MAKLRQFFFDNGKSRKRWQVSLRGKNRILRYGSISGRLREAKQQFSSSAEARVDADRRIAKKKRDGYIEIDPSSVEFVRPKGRRKATAQQIKKLEKLIGSKLPGEYREFLINVNGGRANPAYVSVPGDDMIDNVGVGTFFHLQPTRPVADELTNEIKRAETLLPGGHLPIAGDSDMFSLSLRPESFGAVFWWFHETEEVDDDGNFLEAAGHLLAGSFDEFLTRIAGVFGFDANEKIEKADGNHTKRQPSTLKSLMRAVQREHTPATIKEIKRIIKQLDDLSGIKNGQWPFINIRNAEMLQCLLTAGLHPEITDREGQSLLYQCAACPECIDLLAKRGVELDRRSGGEGETALMRAVFLNDIPSVKRLVKHGANPTLRFPSHVSNELRYNAKLAKVVEQSRAKWKKSAASKKAKSTQHRKPPQRASRGSKASIAELLGLLKKHKWIQEGEQIENVEQLISEIGDLSGIETGQWPAIRKFEDPQLLSLILGAKLNPNIVDRDGNPLLWQCVSHPECITLAVQYGALIDQPNTNGETPLMRACCHGEVDCVEALLDSGADPTVEFTKFAQCMLDMNEEIGELVESARKRWKSKPKRRRKKG